VQPIHELVKIEIVYSNSNHINELEAIWLDLQERSDCHYFLTWGWLGSWLKQVKQPFHLLQAKIQNQIVGLAVIFEKERKVFGLLHKTQWWLNRTGDEKFDQSWIEYNDILVDKRYGNEIKKILVLFISKQTQWSEFIVGMLSSETEDRLNSLAYKKRYIIEDYGYQVNLKDITSSYRLEVLSRNTRQKINQTHRLLSQQGCLNFNVIITQKQKLQKLNSIVAFHVNKWKNTDTPSGFENPIFLNCFEAQLKNEHSEIAELTLNNKPVAYLINYLYKGRVYFYLSALSDEFEGKIKLGMYLHCLTIEYYREKKLTYYDFLAGKSRYKQSLSNSSYTHNMCCFYKDSLLLGSESRLKKLKNKFEHMQGYC